MVASWRLIVPALAMVGVAGTTPAQAEDFYRGKKLVVICSSAPGGGYDQLARLLSRHIARHIPGEPGVIVQNMPGAEGIKAANYIYNLAPQDGTYIGGLPRTISMTKLYGLHDHGVQFDPEKFHWLGSLKRDTGILVVNAKSGITHVQDLKTRPVSVSSQAITSANSVYARLLNATFGSQLKPVEGYEGSIAGLLAVERAEVDGHIAGGATAPVKSKVNGWMAAGQGRVVVQFGLRRDPDYADAPSALELARDERARHLLETAFVEQEIGNPYVLGPKVPNDRVAILEKAFVTMVKDADFLADAKREDADIQAIDGPQIERILTDAYAVAPDILDELRHIARGK